ncbi:MAG: shikimate dehydrogenase [Rhodobiaceae bacterium]|nr:shikimate dehydrogenase [Rhodobiaceae bacterium]
MTDRYAVFGYPLSHTKSPQIHTAFAAEAGEDISYEAIEAPADGFADALHAFIGAGGRGINVTVPFKLEACEIATERRQRAELAGAANCLKFEDGTILAENFDGIGLVADIERNLDYPIRDRRVLLVGAGGAARGAILPLLEAEPDALTIVNRTVAKAQDLKDAFAPFGAIGACGYDDLAGETFDLVINATSASLFGDLPPLPASVFHGDSLAYEMVYGKGLTPFLKVAQASGVNRLVDGVGMLVEQAAEAFHWWRGVRPDTRPVIRMLTVPLA